MINKVHDHIIAELDNSVRTDTSIIVVAVTFNLISLCLNSQASLIGGFGGAGTDVGGTIIFFVFLATTLVFNGLAIFGLMVGRSTRMKLIERLLEMYADNDVGKYYDQSLISNYSKRYILFGAVVIVLGITAIIVPLTMRIFSLSF